MKILKSKLLLLFLLLFFLGFMIGYDYALVTSRDAAANVKAPVVNVKAP